MERGRLPKSFNVGDQFLKPGQNSIGFIRLMLASAVVFYHGFVLGGIEPPGHMQAKLAVAGFFFLSGMLITQSFLHSKGFVDYIWRRTLRIFPGFWGCLLFSAFVVTPIAMALQHEPFPAREAVGYVVHSLPMVYGWASIDHVFSHSAVGNVMNGSLWTLPLEYTCYLVVGLAGAMTLLKQRWLALVAVGLFFLWQVFPQTRLPAIPHVPHGLTAASGIEPFLLFAIGAAAHLYREKIELPAWSGWVACGIIVFLCSYESMSPGFQMASAAIRVIALPIALVWLATILPLRHFDRRRDLSYGTYIYAYPIQQTLLVAGVAGGWPLVFASYVVTLAAAYLSWSLVESPALRLKRVFSHQVPDAAGHMGDATAPAGS
ncbi:MAG TPA: acyltransferase [Fimbriimonadaceae bacterium]|nr:acyltransferase [Fimbriimonadaceae bacterium]